jgi:hypothetical protein
MVDDCRSIGRRNSRTLRVAAEEPKFQGEVLREFNEGDGSVKRTAPATPASSDGTFYNDERPVRHVLTVVVPILILQSLITFYRLLRHTGQKIVPYVYESEQDVDHIILQA